MIILKFIIYAIIILCVDYILFKIFHLFKLYKLSLFILASADISPKKVKNYCSEYCPNKSCDKCILWSCENYGRNK